MANLIFDLSNNVITKKQSNVSTVIYRDINVQDTTVTPVNIVWKNNQYTVYNVNDDTVLVDKECIKKTLRNIFTYKRGEAIIEPTFGNTLYQLLYKSMGDGIKTDIINSITALINIWEPRININNIDINEDQENNLYQIKVIYNIPQLEGIEDTFTTNVNTI